MAQTVNFYPFLPSYERFPRKLFPIVRSNYGMLGSK